MRSSAPRSRESSEPREHPAHAVLAPLALALLVSSASGGGDERPLDYNRDVRPILAANCFACHGFDPKTRKADLRLDRAESAYAEREGVIAIVPGKPEASELWRRITATDPDERMPPPKAQRTLSAAQQAKLRAWIEQGAGYAEHWSFIAPVRPAPPLAGLQPIDAFVRARLAEEHLQPAPPADRATLLRRVTLDLTGLPPSAAELESFVADPDPRAYERCLERLFASPHYGERMALPWLDAARYADTNGFSIDGGRQQWLWRDYVIQAFNTNKPYERFLVEQLAGDLLPERSEETQIATGFQRNAMVTHEGGTIAEENLVIYAADRVKTFGESVLGLTLGCAQCHDHKFDPLTQRDYYSLFAYFDGLSEAAHGGDGGVDAAPTLEAHSVLVTGEEDGLRARIAALEATLAAPAPERVAEWEAEQRAALAARGQGFALHPVKLLKISTPNSGDGFSILDGRFALIERPLGLAAFDVSMELPALDVPISGLRVVMHPAPEVPAAGWGWGGGSADKHSFVLTNLSLSASPVQSDQVNLNRLLAAGGVTANCWEEEQRPEGVLNTSASEGWSPELTHEGPVQLTLSFDEPLAVAAAPYLTAQLNFGRGGDLMAKRMEFFAVSGHDDDSTLPASVIVVLQTAPAARTEPQRATLAAYCSAHGAVFERTRTDLANARERLAARTDAFPVMVMDTAATPRETRILRRGNYADPLEAVTPATPALLPPPPPGAPADRLGLALWVTMPEHPLTARVAVNRFWQMLFGRGLVATLADFGTQGEWPSHPELLDWLAVEFVASGWDVRALLRTMLLSETYRQSSATTAEALARDPDNRLLARGPRFRLPAEFIRDAALKTSGLLVEQLGGPSVLPYLPGDPWREISHYGSTPATAQSFIQDHGEKLYRRSLYTFWKRTLPPPNLALFDAPNREVCTLERGSTNTPLQALVLLNDVQFVEAARAFAERILQRPGSDATRLAWAFTEVTSRAPAPAEAALLQRALVRGRAHFAAAPEAAARVLASGESPRDESLPVVEHAAWSQVAALLLNLSEALTRN